MWELCEVLCVECLCWSMNFYTDREILCHSCKALLVVKSSALILRNTDITFRQYAYLFFGDVYRNNSKTISSIKSFSLYNGWVSGNTNVKDFFLKQDAGAFHFVIVILTRGKCQGGRIAWCLLLLKSFTQSLKSGLGLIWCWALAFPLRIPSWRLVFHHILG